MGYKLKTTKDALYKKGFYYNKFMSSEDSDVYSTKFPVYKYKKSTVLECEVSVELQTGDVVINVFNYGTRDIYAPFYNAEYGKCEILYDINNAIELQLKKFGVKKK